MTHGKKHAEPPLVLVVEDYEDTRTLYGELFRLEGYRVRLASNAERALEAIEVETPAAIIMDLEMGRYDGAEATRHIKSSPRFRSIVVIVVTGVSDLDRLEATKDSGADAIFIKPCRPDALAAALRWLLAGEESRGEPPHAEFAEGYLEKAWFKSKPNVA